MNRDECSISHCMATTGRLDRQQGLSLIELMIGLLIGLILLGGVLQTMLASREASTARESMAIITDNARFLVEFLGRDLRMAGRGCVDGDDDLDCTGNDVDDDGIFELDGTTLKAAYLDPDGNKVIVEFGYVAADGVITYNRNAGGAETLVDRIDGFDVAFGTYDGATISYGAYNAFPANVEDVVSLRFRVEFEDAAAGDFQFDSPVIVSTVALRNRVAKLIN